MKKNSPQTAEGYKGVVLALAQGALGLYRPQVSAEVVEPLRIYPEYVQTSPLPLLSQPIFRHRLQSLHQVDSPKEEV
jgi:hypothetical protein